MKEENYKKLYSCLIETEDLHRMFPRLSGIWEADKNKFIKFMFFNSSMLSDHFFRFFRWNKFS